VLVIAPLLTFACLLLGFYKQQLTKDLRRAFIFGAITWGLLLTLITEGLSAYSTC
jgi:hypothetical protein